MQWKEKAEDAMMWMAIVWVVSAVFWGEGHADMDRVGSGRVGSDQGGAAPAFFDEFSYFGPDGAPSSEAREILSLLAPSRDSPVSRELLFFEVLPFFNSRERERIVTPYNHLPIGKVMMVRL